VPVRLVIEAALWDAAAKTSSPGSSSPTTRSAGVGTLYGYLKTWAVAVAHEHPGGHHARAQRHKRRVSAARRNCVRSIARIS
jgi:hypothetical protein